MGVDAIGVIADALAAPEDTSTIPCGPPPMRSWHVTAGSELENVGQRERAGYCPRPGEDMDAAVQRECTAARTDREQLVVLLPVDPEQRLPEGRS